MSENNIEAIRSDLRALRRQTSELEARLTRIERWGASFPQLLSLNHVFEPSTHESPPSYEESQRLVGEGRHLTSGVNWNRPRPSTPATARVTANPRAPPRRNRDRHRAETGILSLKLNDSN